MNKETRSEVRKGSAQRSMAQGIASHLIQVRKESIKRSLESFDKVAHRLEEVSVIRGIQFINDSKASNVNSAWYALESVHHPVIWLAGGLDRGQDYGPLIPLVRKKVRTLICLGVDNGNIIRTFQPHLDEILEAGDMQSAVNAAYALARPGNVVLLSPACPSFDRFENYAERGRSFTQAIYQL